MSTPKVSKTEAAQRQLDTAIDLFFEEGDALSAYTLAFAAFKVLLNMYPHNQDDDFGEQIDKLIAERIGWPRFSETANFLKHADRDPEGFLEDFDSERVLPVIGLASLLYRRLSGNFSRKMEAFDFWIETLGADELGIEDSDENEERLRKEAEMRQLLKDAPANVRMQFARTSYHYFLDNRERIQAVVAQYQSEGKTLTQALDELMAQHGKNGS
ncbi:MAG TPA: hypothetical protein VFY31_08860 [Macromonas sp.]|nr:hypothetical protein [Macromonas sp.]